MKLGINSSVWSHGGWKFVDSLDRIKAFGFRHVDVLAYGNAHPLKMDAAEKQSAASKFQELGLQASNMVMLPAKNLGSPDTKEREEVLHYYRTAAEFQIGLGGRQVLVGWGCGEKIVGIPHETVWKNSVEALKRLCRWCAGKGIYVTPELDPMVYYLVNGIESMARIIEEVDEPNLFANIDIGHLAITRNSPDDLQKLEGKIIHAHISDCDGKIHSNDIIGTGVTKVSDYLKAIVEFGIDRTCKKLDLEPVAALELGVYGQNIDDPDRWVSESVAYMRKEVPWLTV